MKFFGRRKGRKARPDDVTPLPIQAEAGPFFPALPLAGAGVARLKDCVVVYSNFRAGSHLLQSSLTALTSLRDAGEVFARRSHDPLSFNAFLQSCEVDTLPFLIEPEQQIPGYFRYLFDHLPDDAPMIVSMKYTQAHRLGADDMTGAPILLKVLADYRVPVLHLVRRDVVRQAISHLVAAETESFHIAHADAADGNRKIWLDPAEVLALARTRAEEQRRARAHLEAVSARHLTMYYEELTPGRLPDELRRALRFLDRYGQVPNGFLPETVAMESDRCVANRAEILDHMLARAPDLLHALSG
ncbi:MAG: hypothetical protein IPL38_01395 [Rhodobacter sp.]|nr:hypothetical protein [Rhodobacter sp.]